MIEPLEARALLSGMHADDPKAWARFWSETAGLQGSAHAPKSEMSALKVEPHKGHPHHAKAVKHATGTTTIHAALAGLPVAIPDTYNFTHDQVLTTSATYNPMTHAPSGVLSNDSNPAGGTLTASLVTGVAHGMLAFHPDGSFVYTPPKLYVGTDSFTYNDTNINGVSITAATVTLNVNDAAPTISNVAGTLQIWGYKTTGFHDRTLTVAAPGLDTAVQDAYGDPTTVALASQAAHGTVTVSPNGSFSYVPAPHFVGTDSFTFLASDGILPSATTGTVNLTVTDTAPTIGPGNAYPGMPAPPVLTYSPVHDRPFVVAAPGLKAPVNDAEGDTTTVAITTQPAHGTVTANAADGSFVYTPNALYIGADSFQYTANDGVLTSSPAMIALNVMDTAPAAYAESYTSWSDNALTEPASGGILVPDFDAAHPSLTAIEDVAPSHGIVNLASDGSFVYTPAPGYMGLDSFTYHTFDGILGSLTALIALNVKDNRPQLDMNGVVPPDGTRVDVVGDSVEFGASPPVGSTKSIVKTIWKVSSNAGYLKQSSASAAVSFGYFTNVPYTAPNAPGNNRTTQFYWDESPGITTVTAYVTYDDGTKANANIKVSVGLPDGLIDPTNLGSEGVTPVPGQMLRSDVGGGNAINYTASASPDPISKIAGSIGVIQVMNAILTRASVGPPLTREYLLGSGKGEGSYLDVALNATSPFVGSITVPLGNPFIGSSAPRLVLSPTTTTGLPVSSYGASYDATDYLMYCPPGGIWVPIGSMNWTSQGSASFNPATAIWSLVPNAGATMTQIAAPYSTSTQWPSWPDGLASLVISTGWR